MKKHCKGEDTVEFDFGCLKAVKDYDFGTCGVEDHRRQIENYCPMAGAEYGIVARQADEETGMTLPSHARLARGKVLNALAQNISARRAEEIERRMDDKVKLEQLTFPNGMDYEYGEEDECATE